MLKNYNILRNLSLKEKATLLSGKNTWETQEIKDSVPSIFLSDGPHGLRKQVGASDHLGLNASQPATCFPTAATLANSWDEHLVEEIGQALGKEAEDLDVQVILGPGLNIKRNPKCGRNFEYYSEDPYLSGKMAGASIRGIQANGTIACPKHFAVNSQEYRRMASDSIVDERTMREIYLTGFEIAIKEGQPRAIMSAYNKINGIYANEHPKLLQEILVDEWGFEGFVVSDWGGDNNHVEAIKAGSHLAMPSLGTEGAREVVKAVQEGNLSEETLNQRVDEILTVILDVPVKKEESPTDWKKHHQLAKEAAMKSAVLLKNEAAVLPIQSTQKVGFIGEFAEKPRYQGAGSSMVNAHQLENVVDLLADYPLNISGFELGYRRGANTDDNLIKKAVELANNSEVVVVYAGLDESYESEGMDRTHLSLPQSQLELLEALATTETKIVVVLSAGSVVEMPWLKNISGLIHLYLSGEAGASASLEVLTGRYNPSGKLSETYPLSYQEVPFGEEYPAMGPYAYYKEGPFVGYRYYNTKKNEVLFPFGYGLSYTDFKYSQLHLMDDGICFTLTNTGHVAGEEIVQMYVTAPKETNLRPVHELKGFKKVSLQAQESCNVFLPFDDYTFRTYNVKEKEWQVNTGLYIINVGGHSRELPLSLEVFKEGVAKEVHVLLSENYQTLSLNQITMKDFETLYQEPVPVFQEHKRQLLHENSTLSDLQYAPGFLGRQVYRVLHRLLKRSQRKGTPNLNLLFIYNMPFRAIGKMTNGLISSEMSHELVRMGNGHVIKGGIRFIQQFFVNKKENKRWRSKEEVMK